MTRLPACCKWTLLCQFYPPHDPSAKPSLQPFSNLHCHESAHKSINVLASHQTYHVQSLHSANDTGIQCTVLRDSSNISCNATAATCVCILLLASIRKGAENALQTSLSLWFPQAVQSCNDSFFRFHKMGVCWPAVKTQSRTISANVLCFLPAWA